MSYEITDIRDERKVGRPRLQRGLTRRLISATKLWSVVLSAALLSHVQVSAQSELAASDLAIAQAARARHGMVVS
jgi:hypothetical protein